MISLRSTIKNFENFDRVLSRRLFVRIAAQEPTFLQFVACDLLDLAPQPVLPAENAAKKVASARSFEAERFDRIKPRRPAGRIKAEEQTDQRRKDDAAKYGKR